MAVSSVDVFSRILIIFASFFSVAALTLAIVGLSTQYWSYTQFPNGTIVNYNLFTQCVGRVNNSSSTCADIPRTTDFGVGTLHAAAFLIVAICLLGCAMLILISMICIQLTGLLVFIPPILLFLAALFMVATFAETSRVTTYNNYSAILVQSSHVATIFSLGISALAAGRLHLRYYEQF